MDEIIREQPFSGRVIGIKASYSPQVRPGNRAAPGKPAAEREHRRPHARRSTSGPARRSWSAPAVTATIRSTAACSIPGWREPAYTSSGWALLGPRGQDASGIIAVDQGRCEPCGMQQNLSYGSTYHFPGTLATRDSYTDMLPGHPTFPFRGSTGINVADAEFEHMIVVNQVGKRFYNELNLTDKQGGAAFPADPSKGQPTKGLDFKQWDWRNASADNVKKTYRETNGIYAAMAPNEGSTAPDFLPGPIWAIFDRAAVERDKWNIDPPSRLRRMATSSRPTRSTIWPGRSEKGHEFQRVP